MNDSNPTASAAGCFPSAAAANRSVFYNHDGSAKTVREVYGWAVKQPQLSQKTLAQVAATPDSAPVRATVPSLPVAASSFAQPLHSRSDDWSTLSLFTGASNIGSTASLFSNAPLPQAPFVLTPGVVSLLASMTPDTASHNSQSRKAA